VTVAPGGPTAASGGAGAPAAGPNRDTDLILARIHLRVGLLSLARAELETMAGRNLLDDEGVLDLAEARWRTGDLPGAGDAAAAYLERQPDVALALVIAAEAESHLGRTVDARRLAGRALERAGGSIDAIFAGMPRSGIWPADPNAEVEPAGTLFADAIPATAAEHRPATPATAEVGPQVAAAPSARLWGDEEVATSAEPADLIEAARADLAGGRVAEAALALGLALRTDPAMAPAVVDAVARRTEPALLMVRGDAYRLAGHESEARRAYAAAAAAASDNPAAPTPAAPSVAPAAPTSSPSPAPSPEEHT
jgi:tetratricopeptide (TPR) repeat protein